MKYYFNMFIGLIVGAMIMMFMYTASAKEHCIVIDGIEYCHNVQNIKVGKTELHVVDPNVLFAAAKESKLEKLGLWQEYKYPKFIRELARQNNMKPQELIDYLAKYDPSWKALKELEKLYPNLKRDYSDHAVQQSIQDIMKQIMKDILIQLNHAI